MNIRRISTAVLGAQFLIATTLASFTQTNQTPTTVSKQYVTVSNMGTAPTGQATNGAGASAGNQLAQIRTQAAQCSASAVWSSNETPINVGNLEWTGQYVERFVRIPEGNSGKPKLVRFLIPVYREKSTKPEASVGTGDKEKQD